MFTANNNQVLTSEAANTAATQAAFSADGIITFISNLSNSRKISKMWCKGLQFTLPFA